MDGECSANPLRIDDCIGHLSSLELATGQERCKSEVMKPATDTSAYSAAR